MGMRMNYSITMPIYYFTLRKRGHITGSTQSPNKQSTLLLTIKGRKRAIKGE